MKTIYIERSTGSARDGTWTKELSMEGVERIVVGIGPGSFAGIRSAIAFARGYALGRPCEVLGLPSPCAIAAQLGGEGRLAVVGDARRGKLWVALFDGLDLLGGKVSLCDACALREAVPEGCRATTPDGARIGDFLRDALGSDYIGETLPNAEGLRMFAEAKPGALVQNPLPLYLSPAVR